MGRDAKLRHEQINQPLMDELAMTSFHQVRFYPRYDSEDEVLPSRLMMDVGHP